MRATPPAPMSHVVRVESGMDTARSISIDAATGNDGAAGGQTGAAGGRSALRVAAHVG
jgi:hypothetical protein